MALNFPSSPQVGDVYNFGSTSYRWDGSSWATSTNIQTSGYTGSRGYTGSQGIIGYTGSIGSSAEAVAGFRNRLINGGFSIAQRAASQTQATQGYGSVDRWAFGSFAGTWTATATTFLGLMPNSSYLNINATSVVNGALYQMIEGVGTTQNRTFTLSYYFGVNSGTDTGGPPYVVQNFGSGGSLAVNVSASSDTTVGDRRFVTFVVPSITGKTVGPGNCLQVVIPFSGTFNKNFHGAQFEEGLVATPFEARPAQVEMALCQRYYEVCSALWTGNVSASTSYMVAIPFAVEKRATPTLISISQSGILNGSFGTRVSGGATTRTGFWTGVATATIPAAGFNDVFAASVEL